MGVAEMGRPTSEFLAGRPLRVLIVDDDQFAARVTERSFKSSGDFELTYSSRPSDALQRLEDQISDHSPPFDIVVIDFWFTNDVKDGLDLADKFFRLSPQTYVALVTVAKEDELPPDRLASCGVLMVIEKPLVLGKMAVLLGDVAKFRQEMQIL